MYLSDAWLVHSNMSISAAHVSFGMAVSCARKQLHIWAEEIAERSEDHFGINMDWAIKNM
jgi:hypothetical protein